MKPLLQENHKSCFVNGTLYLVHRTLYYFYSANTNRVLMKMYQKLYRIASVTALLAIYICFFSVQLVYGYDAASLIHKAELKALSSPAAGQAVIRAEHSSNKKNLHLNKRFQKESVAVPVTVGVPFLPEYTIHVYYGTYTVHFSSGFHLLGKPMRGPPVC